MATTEQVADMLLTMKKMMDAIAAGAAANAPKASDLQGGGFKKEFLRNVSEFDGDREKYSGWRLKVFMLSTTGLWTR